MKHELEMVISRVVKDLFDVDVVVGLTRPDEQFGDYSTNVALQVAGPLNRNPREVAQTIAEKLEHEAIESANVAVPGFINLKLTDTALRTALQQPASQKFKGREVLVEFGDPNPFKEMHLGHLYTTIVGDAIACLFEAAGAEVRRLSYHGDVGRHVAMAIWGMRQALVHERGIPASDELTEEVLVSTIKNNLGMYYADGARAFAENEKASEEIRAINEQIYKRDNPTVNTLYNWGRDRSLGDFQEIFNELGVHYDKQYFESDSAKVGMEIVRQHTSRVFEESEGAIIYDGEKAGLHKRVFINSRGLPTYETKDLGLAKLKNKDFPNTAQSIIITAHEQAEYFKVMLAALREIDAELASKTKHIAHGFLSLTTGKMSSRTGSIYSAATLMAKVKEAASNAYPESTVQQEVYLAALKYTFLKSRIGGDIVFDVQESVSLEGNSGPYLQYAHARARSILGKSEIRNSKSETRNQKMEAGERSLVRKIGEYPEVVEQAVKDLLPSHICTYLYELSQTFNSFYEHNRVIGDERQDIRLTLVQAYADVLKSGLGILNIPAPDRM